jgi:hypothetical protein
MVYIYMGFSCSCRQLSFGFCCRFEESYIMVQLSDQWNPAVYVIIFISDADLIRLADFSTNITEIHSKSQ